MENKKKQKRKREYLEVQAPSSLLRVFALSSSKRAKHTPSDLHLSISGFQLRLKFGKEGGRTSNMPTLQSALPPELANNAIRVTITSLTLYRECFRRAEYIGSKQHNTELLVTMVREQFKRNMHEKDPEKIQKLKDDAARGLINHMLFEAEKMSGWKFSKS